MVFKCRTILPYIYSKDVVLKSPHESVLVINEQGYIFMSSEINAENLAASQESSRAEFAFIQVTIPETQQLSNPILTDLHAEALS